MNVYKVVTEDLKKDEIVQTIYFVSAALNDYKYLLRWL